MMLGAVLSLGCEIPGVFFCLFFHSTDFHFLKTHCVPGSLRRPSGKGTVLKDQSWDAGSSSATILLSHCPTVIREIREKLGQENIRWHLPTSFHGTGPTSGVLTRNPWNSSSLDHSPPLLEAKTTAKNYPLPQMLQWTQAHIRSTLLSEVEEQKVSFHTSRGSFNFLFTPLYLKNF